MCFACSVFCSGTRKHVGTLLIIYTNTITVWNMSLVIYCRAAIEHTFELTKHAALSGMNYDAEVQILVQRADRECLGQGLHNKLPTLSGDGLHMPMGLNAVRITIQLIESSGQNIRPERGTFRDEAGVVLKTYRARKPYS